MLLNKRQKSGIIEHKRMGMLLPNKLSKNYKIRLISLLKLNIQEEKHAYRSYAIV